MNSSIWKHESTSPEIQSRGYWRLLDLHSAFRIHDLLSVFHLGDQPRISVSRKILPKRYLVYMDMIQFLLHHLMQTLASVKKTKKDHSETRHFSVLSDFDGTRYTIIHLLIMISRRFSDMMICHLQYEYKMRSMHHILICVDLLRHDFFPTFMKTSKRVIWFSFLKLEKYIQKTDNERVIWNISCHP